MTFQPRSFTFYSYKGGVGRSMALLNVAYYLQARGRHVLIVDLDLDAPGASGFLHRAEELIPQDNAGDVVDVLAEVVRAVRATPDGAEPSPIDLKVETFLRSVDPEKYAPAVHPRVANRARLDVLAADNTRNYAGRLAALELAGLSAEQIALASDLFRTLLFGHRFSFTQPWQAPEDPPEETAYDYILIDSRTGLSETGGLCVGPLSDRLVVLCGLNDQNINGTKDFLDVVGLQRKARTTKSEIWDSADPIAGAAHLRPPTIGPKPTLLVASPVPGGEITYKKKRMDVLENEIGLAPVKLSYHPQMALMETLFVRDHPDEYLAIEYATLASKIMGMVEDTSAQLENKLQQIFRKTRDSDEDEEISIDWVPIRARIALETGLLSGMVPYHYLSKQDAPIHEQNRSRYLRINLASSDEEAAWAWVSWADDLDTEEARNAGDTQIFQAMEEKYEKAISLNPEFHEALNNWGAALLKWARTKEGADAGALFTESIEKFQAALAIKPDKHEALNNWGVTLSDLAQTKKGAEAEALFIEAIGKHQAAVAIKPDKHETFFNLACIAALRGDVETVITELERWKDAAPSPTRAELDDDEDFDKIRDEPQFLAFRETLPEGEKEG